MDYTWISWGITGASLAVVVYFVPAVHRAHKYVQGAKARQDQLFALIDDQRQCIADLLAVNADTQRLLSEALALDTSRTGTPADKPESVGEREARKFLKKTAAW